VPTSELSPSFFLCLSEHLLVSLNLPFSQVRLGTQIIIFLLHLVQGSLIYGRDGKKVHRAELDLDVCKEVVTYDYVIELFLVKSMLVLELYFAPTIPLFGRCWPFFN
jgi:hypothetical protein